MRNTGHHEKIRIHCPSYLIKTAVQCKLIGDPGHMNIYSNEKADEKAKLGSKLRTVHHEAITSLSFLKRKVQECCLDDWQKEWQNSKNKSKHY